MSEQIVMKGALEDHQGRIIHPDTEADQVMAQNGKTVEVLLAELLAKFGSYLPLAGGTLTGDVKTILSNYYVNDIGCFSAGSDGIVMIAENAYKHPTNNTYHYSTTNSAMGARGIVFRSGVVGLWYFDTGRTPTTADAKFTPNLISLTDKATKQYTGDLNSITENTIIDCTSLANGPGSDWYFIQHISHSADPANWATQIAYALNSNDVKRRRKNGGVWFEWEPFMTQSNTPTQHYSTAAPTATDGKDGDVWDVYV